MIDYILRFIVDFHPVTDPNVPDPAEVQSAAGPPEDRMCGDREHCACDKNGNEPHRAATGRPFSRPRRSDRHVSSVGATVAKLAFPLFAYWFCDVTVQPSFTVCLSMFLASGKLALR